MEYTFEDLKKKRVVELREIAAGIEHEAVKGYTQMNKGHLLEAVCTALCVDMFEHHVVKDTHKSGIKTQIKELKTKRDKVLAAHKKDELHIIQKRIRKLKRTLRKMAV